jgi:hypothetical protein
LKWREAKRVPDSYTAEHYDARLEEDGWRRRQNYSANRMILFSIPGLL